MSDNQEGKKNLKFIRVICGDMKESELLEAEQNFKDYLLLVKQICDRKESNEFGVGNFDENEIIE